MGSEELKENFMELLFIQFSGCLKKEQKSLTMS
jgi:hypothetical protein